MNAKAQFYLVRLDSLIAETEVNVLCQVGTDPIEVTRLAVSRWLHCIEVVVQRSSKTAVVNAGLEQGDQAV